MRKLALFILGSSFAQFTQAHVLSLGDNAEEKIAKNNKELAYAETRLNQLNQNYNKAATKHKERSKIARRAELETLMKDEKESFGKYQKYRDKVYKALPRFNQDVEKGFYNEKTLELMDSVQRRLGFYVDKNYEKQVKDYYQALKEANKWK